MDARMVSVKKVCNLGNYENVAVEMQAIPDIGEDPSEVAAKLGGKIDTFVQDHYGVMPRQQIKK